MGFLIVIYLLKMSLLYLISEGGMKKIGSNLKTEKIYCYSKLSIIRPGRSRLLEFEKI